MFITVEAGDLYSPGLCLTCCIEKQLSKKCKPINLGKWSADGFSGDGEIPMNFLTSGSAGGRIKG